MVGSYRGMNLYVHMDDRLCAPRMAPKRRCVALYSWCPSTEAEAEAEAAMRWSSSSLSMIVGVGVWFGWVSQV